jgi:hypothetical protein
MAKSLFTDGSGNWKLVGGNKLYVNSTYRSPESQQRLLDIWIKQGKKRVPGGEVVAQPSSPKNSMHCAGMAIDIRESQADALDRAGILAKFKMYRPYPTADGVHIQPAGSPKRPDWVKIKDENNKAGANDKSSLIAETESYYGRIAKDFNSIMNKPKLAEGKEEFSSNKASSTDAWTVDVQDTKGGKRTVEVSERVDGPITSITTQTSKQYTENEYGKPKEVVKGKVISLSDIKPLTKKRSKITGKYELPKVKSVEEGFKIPSITKKQEVIKEENTKLSYNDFVATTKDIEAIKKQNMSKYGKYSIDELVDLIFNSDPDSEDSAIFVKYMKDKRKVVANKFVESQEIKKTKVVQPTTPVAVTTPTVSSVKTDIPTPVTPPNTNVEGKPNVSAINPETPISIKSVTDTLQKPGLGVV